MARRKRYIKGRVYLIDDKVLSLDGYSKRDRRVVALNNDKNKMHVAKIKSLYDSNGNKRSKLIPIEKYPAIRKPSGVYTYVYKKTKWNTPIKERKLVKTNTRLNKWDMKKISKLR